MAVTTLGERIHRHNRKLWRLPALAKVIKVRDGDTFVITIEDTPDVFGEEIAVRIRGIDTPELNDKREEIKAIAISQRDAERRQKKSWR